MGENISNLALVDQVVVFLNLTYEGRNIYSAILVPERSAILIFAGTTCFICLSMYTWCQVLGESAGSMLGRDLEALIQRARDYKKEYGDSFMSVEHLVLGFVQDNRFGKQLFKDFQISRKALKDAIEAIRGRQKVIDQGDNSYFLVVKW